MSTGFWNSRTDVEASMAAQLEALRKELKSLRRLARTSGQASYDEAREQASEVMDELRVHLADAGERIGRGARQASDRVRENPATAAAVGLVVAGLVTALLASRSRR